MTVQGAFNELFLLLKNNQFTWPSFRNPKTEKLKEHFVFVVDNGPSEASPSPLVRMWLVRLARLLQLKSVTQKSFAEYHSKRNPMERVHAVYDHALSNEQFSRKGVHDDYGIGDSRHHQNENMQYMAGEVKQCLMHTQCDGDPCVIRRGISSREESFVFKGEDELVAFLGISERRKCEGDSQYEPVKNEWWRGVATVWNLDENFVGSYREDYEIMQNNYHEEGDRTYWSDKHYTVIFNNDDQRGFSPCNPFLFMSDGYIMVKRCISTYCLTS